jgi:hypothetical protein
MVKKRPINEQDKINFSKGKKFSKENQPSPVAKSEGKKKKKTMREMLDYLLEKEITNKQGEKATTLEAISVALIKQAMNGNVKAFEVLRDTIGQNPMHKVVTAEATEETKEAFLKHLKEL